MKLHVTLNSPHPVHASLSWLLEPDDVSNKENFADPCGVAIVPESLHDRPYWSITDVAAACPSKAQYKVIEWCKSQILPQVNFEEICWSKDIASLGLKNHEALITSYEGTQEEKGLACNI